MDVAYSSEKWWGSVSLVVVTQLKPLQGMVQGRQLYSCGDQEKQPSPTQTPQSCVSTTLSHKQHYQLHLSNIFAAFPSVPGSLTLQKSKPDHFFLFVAQLKLSLGFPFLVLHNYCEKKLQTFRTPSLNLSHWKCNWQFHPSYRNGSFSHLYLHKPPQHSSTKSGTGWQNLSLGFCASDDDAFGIESPAEPWEAKPGVLERC